jgi:hypothetical protein
MVSREWHQCLGFGVNLPARDTSQRKSLQEQEPSTGLMTDHPAEKRKAEELEEEKQKLNQWFQFELKYRRKRARRSGR